MKLSILTLAAVVLGSAAYADITEHPLSSRATPSDVMVFERDKGVYGEATTSVASGALSLVDAKRALFPSEQAIATEGKVAVYTFAGRDSTGAASFPRR